MQAVRNIFSKYPDPARPDKELLQLFQINLTRIDFEFNNIYYWQVTGTAVVKTFAPAFANIFMADGEETALCKAAKKRDHYYRFLYGIWGVWSYKMEEFHSFMDLLSRINTSITVKATIQLTLYFLDTTTYKGMDILQTQKLQTKIFFKPTHYSTKWVTTLNTYLWALSNPSCSDSTESAANQKTSKKPPKYYTRHLPPGCTLAVFSVNPSNNSRISHPELNHHQSFRCCSTAQPRRWTHKTTVLAAFRRRKNLKDLSQLKYHPLLLLQPDFNQIFSPKPDGFITGIHIKYLIHNWTSDPPWRTVSISSHAPSVENNMRNRQYFGQPFLPIQIQHSQETEHNNPCNWTFHSSWLGSSENLRIGK